MESSSGRCRDEEPVKNGGGRLRSVEAGSDPIFVSSWRGTIRPNIKIALRTRGVKSVTWLEILGLRRR